MGKKLNLGSGEYKKSGYINVDFYSISEPDVKHDLNLFPYPFKDDEFSLIEADHILEHLENPFRVMKELHRIGHHKAKIIIRVPHFSRGFTHAEHKSGFDVSFPLYFNPCFKGGYQGIHLDLVRMKLNWFGQPDLKKTLLPGYQFIFGRVIGKIFNYFANLSPYFCSRLWCYWVGGFDEIIFKFEIIK
jgi:hypothetical protein